MERKRLDNLRTWIEIDAKAAKKNYDTFRELIARGAKDKKRPQLWSVVKSNAYGHGLYAFSKLMERFGIDGFCVDSIVEGISLRGAGIKKPILVLGQTLPSRYAEAVKNKITISISNFEALESLAHSIRTGKKQIPDFHIKLDTGMHRQGFYPENAAKIIKFLLKFNGKLRNHVKGIYTHFAAAKDIENQTYTEQQLKEFKKAINLFEKAGFTNVIKHAAATGGTLLHPKYHFDAVRVGIGLYGLWPSKELETQLNKKIKLYPVLSWRTVALEVKKLKPGDYVGYDGTERVKTKTTMVVLPIGYWHGFPRALSSCGEVLIKGNRKKILGRVSMDMVVATASHNVRPGCIVTLIGRDGKEEILAEESAKKSGTIHYEFLTRLNPLMERIVVI